MATWSSKIRPTQKEVWSSKIRPKQKVVCLGEVTHLLQWAHLNGGGFRGSNSGPLAP
jgi:hypothetical protein